MTDWTPTEENVGRALCLLRCNTVEDVPCKITEPLCAVCKANTRAALKASHHRELVEALDRSLDAIEWMSGSDDFSHEGKAGKHWPVVVREQMLKDMKLLALARGETGKRRTG
jgi:hypothetical protein